MKEPVNFETLIGKQYQTLNGETYTVYEAIPNPDHRILRIGGEWGEWFIVGINWCTETAEIRLRADGGVLQTVGHQRIRPVDIHTMHAFIHWLIPITERIEIIRGHKKSYR